MKTTRHLRELSFPTLAILVAAGVFAGCGGGDHRATAKPPASQSTPSTQHVSTGPTRTMRFQLADTSASPASAEVPAQPIASAPTTISGVTLQLYLAKRVRPGAVLVVFALQVTASAASLALDSSVSQALSANFGHTSSLSDSVSGVGLLDPAGLKEYETYMVDPSNDATCLCSSLNGASLDNENQTSTEYFAALVAAPPASVTSVSFVTGLATIGSVPLS